MYLQKLQILFSSCKIQLAYLVFNQELRIRFNSISWFMKIFTSQSLIIIRQLFYYIPILLFALLFISSCEEDPFRSCSCGQCSFSSTPGCTNPFCATVSTIMKIDKVECHDGTILIRTCVTSFTCANNGGIKQCLCRN